MAQYPQIIHAAYAGRRLNGVRKLYHEFVPVTVEMHGSDRVMSINDAQREASMCFNHPLGGKKKFLLCGVYEIKQTSETQFQLANAQWIGMFNERDQRNKWYASDMAAEASQEEDKRAKEASLQWLHDLDDVRAMYGKTNYQGKHLLLAKVIEYITR